MAYLQDFTTLTMSGTLAGGNEIWSCSLHLDSTVNHIPEADWEDFYTPKLDDIGEVVEDFITSPYTMVPAGVILTEVKLTHKDTSGSTIGEPLYYSTNTPGSMTSAYVPQNAMVNTLVSDKARAPGRFNRFYLPIAVSGNSSTYKLTTMEQQQYTLALANLVRDLNAITNTAEDGAAFVSVLSNAGSGHALPVTYAMVGQIVDTQQRRRRSLSESYYTVEINETP